MSVKVKVIISAVSVSVLAVIGLVFMNPLGAKAAGTVTIELCDYELVCTEMTYDFNTGDTVSDILKEYYVVEIITSEYGSYVNDIEGYVTTGGESNAFMAFYVNDESSLVGIDDVELYDGIKLSFKYETW